MAFSSDIPLTSNQNSISLEVPNPEDPRFVDITNLILKRFADSMNTKEGALYTLVEQATFQRWYPTSITAATLAPTSQSLNFRPGYRIVVPFGALATPSVNVIPHGIVGLVQVTDYRAIVNTALPDFRVVPYVPVAGEYIAMAVDTVNFTIAVGPGTPAITSGFAVIEYLKIA
jgi:hypothetical protein